MDREFMDGTPQGYRHRFRVMDTGERSEIPERGNDDTSLSCVHREPAVEVHRIGNEVKVIADLPGITEEALRLDVKGNTLVIDAGDAEHCYHTSAALPPVDTASMQKTLKNGVLDVTFTSLQDPSEKS
jgi:HSP20 family molecular chaperone IbpA